MSLQESDRRAIYDGFEPILGPETTDKFLALLPRQPASELVTRSDMHANTIMLRGEMAELRGELRGEMAELRSELRGEMAELRSELRGEMAELRSELCGEMAELRADLTSIFRSEVAGLKASNQRWMAAVITANALGMFSAIAL